MSAILSADDLNDFISPGVACIKPIETVASKSTQRNNTYEVTTEDQLAASLPPPPATISLTDCLACSGCVTSAEAVLVSLQSQEEVLRALDQWKSRDVADLSSKADIRGIHDGSNGNTINTIEPKKIFVATVSSQVRANLAAVYRVPTQQVGNMIDNLLCGPDGISRGGAQGSRFQWVFDTDVFRDMALVVAAEEVADLLNDPERTVRGDGDMMADAPKKPILTSACPGWICYAEKTHPHILPHLSRLKSPQAIAGTMVKSILAKQYNVHPSEVWHLAVMPCFDKKLEASRSELTSAIWSNEHGNGVVTEAIRDVDCVITARELIALAASRGIDFGSISSMPLSRTHRLPFPDPLINSFLFPSRRGKRPSPHRSAGTSGGYLWHILRRLQVAYPGSNINSSRGRNADVVEYTLVSSDKTPIVRFARYYGFRNIQNLVRKLKPAKTSRLLNTAAARGNRLPSVTSSRPTPGFLEHTYVEVMACPGGCTNGGGQVRAGEVDSLRANLGLPTELARIGPAETKSWLADVDEAYFSTDVPSDQESESRNEGIIRDDVSDSSDVVDGISRSYIIEVISRWSKLTDIDPQSLTCTSYRKVESDVGKKVSDVERVAGLASSLGGGW